MTTSISERASRATWEAHYTTPDGFRYMPAEELVRFCGRRRHTLGRVLEVGCGSGANLWYLAEQTDDPVVGVDFCDSVLPIARATCARRGATMTPVLASSFELPFQDGTFDTVVDAMMSQHVAWGDHRRLFTEYRRVLRTGGTTFIYNLVQGTSGSARGTFDHPEGIGLFPEAGRLCLPTTGALTECVWASGFGPINHRAMERTYPDGTRACYAVLEGTAR